MSEHPANYKDVELLPCPFCGFKPEAADEDCIYPINQKREVWNLVCYVPGGGCDASVLGDSPQDVIDRWNKRA